MSNLRVRAQSKRALERDAMETWLNARIAMEEPKAPSDDDDDETYGSHATKAGPKRKRSSVLQSLKQQLPPMQLDSPIAAPLDEDFVPLNDLKGADSTAVVGRRIRVWYDTGGDDEAPDVSSPRAPEPPTLQPALGLVTYFGTEGRLHVVFDGDDDADGWWVDSRDEWEWVDESAVGPAPPALPVPGCWRAHTADDVTDEPEEKCHGSTSGQCEVGEGSNGDGGLDAMADHDSTVGDIERIFLMRSRRITYASGAPHDDAIDLFVKWKGLAHVHCQWVPQTVLERSDALNKRRVAKFVNQVRAAMPAGDELRGGAGAGRDLIASTGGVLAEGEEAYNPMYNEVEKVLAQRPGDGGGPPEWLVKWRGLPHANSTWEGCRLMVGFQCAINQFYAHTRTPPTPKEMAVAACVPYRPTAANFRPFESSPVYKAGRTLRPHQIDGLNWLLFSW